MASSGTGQLELELELVLKFRSSDKLKYILSLGALAIFSLIGVL